MGFWNKLGKIALQAAPYVAAPFTGGASLLATGATQKLGQKWAESDAKKAIAKGLAPSKFDSILGKVSMGAGLASGLTGGFGGALGGAGKVGAGLGKGANIGSIASKTPTSVGGWAGNLGKIATAASGKGGSGWTGALGKAASTAIGGKAVPGSDVGKGDWEGALGAIMAQRGQPAVHTGDGSVPPSNVPQVGGGPAIVSEAPNYSTPRPTNGLAGAVARGRGTALMNQPFRQGYEIKTQGPEDENGVPSVITNRTAPIYPNYPPPTPIQNRFSDELTPSRTARRRQPVPVEEYQ